MKKFISILLLISSIVSYYIVYGNEQNNFTKNMDEIEMNLANSYQLMIPVNIDKKDKNQSYKDIVKILDRYEGSIYYDRMSKDESTRVKYIYDIFNMYTSNINIIDGKQITSELMESNKYLSTRKITDDLQIGRIATFNKNVNFEIRTLKSMLDENYSFTGPCYVSFKSNIDINAFINELEKELDTKGIVTINKVPINIIQENNYQIIIIIIYFIVMLLLLYELLNSYKKIGIKKMLGYSIKDIYLENILQLIKINLSVGLIVILSMSFIFFNQLNIYVYTFIFKFIFYTLINTLFLAIVCSIVYIYIVFIKIPNMLKNKKPLIGIIVLNYIAKIVCLISMMFFIVQAIDNTQNISSIFNENYSNWEALDGYGIVPVSKIPIEAFNSPDYPKIQQKIYKEFNAKGGILAHFNEFSPAVRSDRLKASNFYYERDNVVVNPNYLNKYKLYDSNNNEIVISENDVDQIILVADKYKDDEKNILKVANSYKEQEFFSTGENQKTKIIWTKSNQKVFTAAVDINPDSGNCIVDPIIYVLTENNGTTSDYDCLLGKMGNPFKIKADKNKTPEVTIREMFAKYGIEDYIGTITSVNEQISTSINNVKDNIKNAIIFTSLLMIILIITIIQNVINYIDKYKQKLAIEKLIGYTILDKHKIYLIGTIVCWNIVFSLSILLYKTAIIKIAIVSMIGFIIEIIFSLIILNVIEKRKIIGILKGE